MQVWQESRPGPRVLLPSVPPPGEVPRLWLPLVLLLLLVLFLLLVLVLPAPRLRVQLRRRVLFQLVVR